MIGSILVGAGPMIAALALVAVVLHVIGWYLILTARSADR